MQRLCRAAIWCAAGAVFTACGGGGGGTSGGAGTPSTPAPGPSFITATPSTLSFSGTAQKQTVTISEASYSGAFIVESSCSNIATTGAPNGNGPQATLTVSSVAIGSCKIVVSDGRGKSADISVTVTTGTGVIQ